MSNFSNWYFYNIVKLKNTKNSNIEPIILKHMHEDSVKSTHILGNDVMILAKKIK